MSKIFNKRLMMYKIKMKMNSSYKIKIPIIDKIGNKKQTNRTMFNRKIQRRRI